MLPGVLPSTPDVLTWLGVLNIHAPTDAASAKKIFVAGIRSVCGVNLVTTIPLLIPGLVGRGKIGMVW